tara:strand:+ start:1484 stop:2665 length:1182 start_codon:yes stop_codon:yes gene_type:complete
LSKTFANWSGLVQSTPQDIIQIATIQDAQKVVSIANKIKAPITTVGSSHSHSRLIQNNTGIIIRTDQVKGTITINESDKTATVPSGMTLKEAAKLLWDKGYAFSNQGDVDVQSIAGLIGTGVHGTGITHPSISTHVQDATIIISTGDIIKASENNEVLEATRLNLGAIGLIMDITFAVVPIFFLYEKTWKQNTESLIEEVDKLAKENDHFEFFWNPLNDTTYIKTLNPHNGPATSRNNSTQNYVDYSHQVFPSDRNDKHTEMEYSIPYHDGVACFKEIRNLILSRKHKVFWPVEYRTVAADSGWISPSKNRLTVTISIHQGLDQPHEPFFREAEQVFRTYDGRPHWGKCNYLTHSDFALLYEEGWTAFWKVQRELDPEGVFLSSYLQSLRNSE